MGNGGLAVTLSDGHGTGNVARIDPEGTFNAVLHNHPPVQDDVNAIPFRQFFTDDGTPTGASDMKVTGTVSIPLIFSITADATRDTFVKTVAIVVADQNAVLNKFGNITALTNGVQFCHITSDTGTTILHDGMKSNFDFVQLAQGNPAFGDGTAAFRANNITTAPAAEGYIPIVDFAQVFGFPYGLRLRKGTTDAIFFNIQDDVTGVDRFDAQGYGMQL